MSGNRERRNGAARVEDTREAETPMGRRSGHRKSVFTPLGRERPSASASLEARRDPGPPSRGMARPAVQRTTFASPHEKPASFTSRHEYPAAFASPHEKPASFMRAALYTRSRAASSLQAISEILSWMAYKFVSGLPKAWRSCV